MYDINFYMKINGFKKKLVAGEKLDPELVLAKLEDARSNNPVIYNIETTNACNMRCKMCPRTTMMTRDVETIDPALFKKVVDQIEPHSSELWKKWEDFLEEEYGCKEDEMSEN